MDSAQVNRSWVDGCAQDSRWLIDLASKRVVEHRHTNSYLIVSERLQDY